ncbi:MAG: cytochrome c [Acidobacteria bacterium]|nr:cytochrome c [Acidobacteriota bacterium]
MLSGNRNLVVLAIALATCVAALAQGLTYNLGRAPSEEEIKVWDIAVGPAGKELPPGSGTTQEGAKIYAQKCAACHGPTGAEMTIYHRPLVGGKGTLTTTNPVRSIGTYWPFATTIWDYINRAMPQDQQGTLSANEVYALTAFLLYRNDIIKESDVIDAASLPKIQMPNRNGFFPAEPEWKPGYYQHYFSPQPVPRRKP